MHFVGISGSLRKGSFNTLLLQASMDLLPAGVTMEICSIAEIPVYNADHDLPIAAEPPASVTTFRRVLAKANGLVIVSPEYNFSIPGGLKNAIDWASTGADSPLVGLPVALMGVTPGHLGTVRMQSAFLPVFLFLNMKPVYKPEVLVAHAQTKFDETGRLTDGATIDLVKKKLRELKETVLQHQRYA